MSGAAAVRNTAPAAARVSAGWIVLDIDGLRLALPQKNVRLIGLTADLGPGADSAAGWLRRDSGESWPAYCLDGELQLQRKVNAARRVCVFLDAAGDMFGVVCDHVRSLATDTELAVDAVPGCMTGTTLPVTGLARYRDHIVLVLDAGSLANYLAVQRRPAHGACE